MALSAQDKIMYVANKLGLATLKDMQGSTGAVYDSDVNNSGVLFANAAQHVYPNETNLNDNRFEVNEALLIETIGFVAVRKGTRFTQPKINPLWEVIGQNGVIVFDLIIGNKRVLKDTPIFAGGNPSTFASVSVYNKFFASTDQFVEIYNPRTQIFLEGAGILIPPQVEFQVTYKVYDVVSGQIIPSDVDYNLEAYLFGTKVNLNFNTSL